MPRRGRASSSFGSTGVGALDYLAAELFMRETGISMVHVPYRAGRPRSTISWAARSTVIIEVFPVVMEQIQGRA